MILFIMQIYMMSFLCMPEDKPGLSCSALSGIRKKMFFYKKVVCSFVYDALNLLNVLQCFLGPFFNLFILFSFIC